MSYLPKAVLGAVIVSAAIGLVDRAAWRGLAARQPVRARDRRRDDASASSSSASSRRSTIAVALSIVDVVRRSAQPHDAVLGWVDRLGR